MSRSERLRRGAGQRAMTRGEERLARPMGREMKPETAHTPADAARDCPGRHGARIVLNDKLAARKIILDWLD